MFKSIWSYFWRKSEGDLSLDEAYEILESSENISKAQKCEVEDEKYSFYQKSGIITSIDRDYCIIDHVYKFKNDLKNLHIGSKVYFTIYTVGDEIRVTNVTIEEDWFFDSINEKGTWCNRNIICKVDKRNGRRIFVTPVNVDIDLNTVAAEFIPIIGDWLELEAKVALNENVLDLFGEVLEIERVRPLCPQIVEGFVKMWNENTETGLINFNIFFNRDALSLGYNANVGDKVIAEVIESDQDKCTCRALKVVAAVGLYNNKFAVDSVIPKFDVSNPCVHISDDIVINAKKLNETHNISVQVHNVSENDLTLVNISLPLNNAHCDIIKPTLIKSIVMVSDEYITIELTCTVRNLGISRTLMLFLFDSFSIGRWITVNIEKNVKLSHGTYRRECTNGMSFTNSHFNDDKNYVRGENIKKFPRFVHNKLLEYTVPEKFINLAYKCKTQSDLDFTEELRIIKPSLNTNFTFHVYEDKFHTLIHLEEIELIIMCNDYAQERACFIKCDEYLLLEIENLSERRPSLMIGDRVITKDPFNKDSKEYEGYIHKLGGRHIYLKFASAFHELYNGEDMSVKVVTSRTSFRKIHQAISFAVRYLGSSFLFPTRVVTKKAQANFIFDENQDNNNTIHKRIHKNQNLNKIFAMYKTQSNMQNEIDSTQSQLPFNSTIHENNKNSPALKLEWFNKKLNYYQKQAIKNILIGEARPLPYIIFGPPGTGKTVTVIEAILQLLRFIPHSRLLVATPSNSAADLIALRLIDSGMLKPGDLIRLVGYRHVLEGKLPVKLVPYCATIDFSIEGTSRNFTNVEKDKLIIGCNSTVIGRHRITVGTCNTLGTLHTMNFTKGHFTHIIVDEAGQATEPEIMVPLTFLDLKLGQVILAGDPAQLGPVLLSKAAKDFGLDETYLDRILNRFPYIRDKEGFPETGGYDPRLITKLVYNYRSLPSILTMSSNMFYDGQLISTISPIESEEAHLLSKVKEILPKCANSLAPAVVFHGVVGDNYQSADCPSWYNPDEASQVFYYVNELYRLGLKNSDIGIVTPYIKQVKQIRTLINEAEFDMPKVGSIEEFQGQEFKIILLSLVRSDEQLLNKYDFKYNIGFLSNPKRINVAITRAQALLIIIGNPRLMMHDLHWNYVIKYCIETGAYCGCDITLY